MKASNGPLDIDVAFHVIDGDTAQESVAFVKSSRLAKSRRGGRPGCQQTVLTD